MSALPEGGDDAPRAAEPLCSPASPAITGAGVSEGLTDGKKTMKKSVRVRRVFWFRQSDNASGPSFAHEVVEVDTRLHGERVKDETGAVDRLA